MKQVTFRLNYTVPITATTEEAIEIVRKYIEEDGISSAINIDNLVSLD